MCLTKNSQIYKFTEDTRSENIITMSSATVLEEKNGGDKRPRNRNSKEIGKVENSLGEKTFKSKCGSLKSFAALWVI